MDEQFNTGLRTDRARRIPIVPHHTHKPAHVGHDDICEPDIIVQERRCGGNPKIAMVVDKIIIQPLSNTELPTRCEIITITQIRVEAARIRALRVKESSRCLHFIRARAWGRHHYRASENQANQNHRRSDPRRSFIETPPRMFVRGKRNLNATIGKKKWTRFILCGEIFRPGSVPVVRQMASCNAPKQDMAPQRMRLARFG